MTSTAATVRVDAPLLSDGVEIVQFQTAGLGDSSYLLRSGGEAAVIDPQRDIDRFRQALRGLRVVAVVETHVHNDYVSGGPALAREFGAAYVVPTGAGYELEHRAVGDGDEVQVGAVRLRALHTPGHTAHHMSYAVVEGDGVRAVFSGGSVLVGACGRTDLISPELTESLTRDQYRSAQRIGALPPPAAIGPTHGAGSFCAASAPSDDTWTTVAREKTRNPAYLAESEDDFVRQQLAGLPDYREMAPINRCGAPAWEPAAPERLGADRVDELVAAGAVVVDGRPRQAFAAAHLPGSVNNELDSDFATYLGWLYPFGTRFVLVLDASQDALEAVRQAARIGIETIAGVTDVETWRAAGRAVATGEMVDVDALRAAMARNGARVLDVRQEQEWRDGHVPGTAHIHVADLPGRTAEMRGTTPVYTYCRSGRRAAMAASILEAAGIPAVAVDGGFDDWRAHGHPVE